MEKEAYNRQMMRKYGTLQPHSLMRNYGFEVMRESIKADEVNPKLSDDEYNKRTRVFNNALSVLKTRNADTFEKLKEMKEIERKKEIEKGAENLLYLRNSLKRKR
jgi:hypothetical protein